MSLLRLGCRAQGREAFDVATLREVFELLGTDRQLSNTRIGGNALEHEGAHMTADQIICPSCGCEFESERELQSHDSRVHGVGEDPEPAEGFSAQTLRMLEDAEHEDYFGE